MELCEEVAAMEKYLVRPCASFAAFAGDGEFVDASSCNGDFAWSATEVVVFDEEHYGWIDYLMSFPFMRELGFVVVDDEADANLGWGMGDIWFKRPDELVMCLLSGNGQIPEWLEFALDPWCHRDAVYADGVNGSGYRGLTDDEDNAFYLIHLHDTCDALIRGGLPLTHGQAGKREFKRVIAEALGAPLGSKETCEAIRDAVEGGVVSLSRFSEFVDVLEQCVDAIEHGVPAEDVFA